MAYESELLFLKVNDQFVVCCDGSSDVLLLEGEEKGILVNVL